MSSAVLRDRNAPPPGHVGGSLGGDILDARPYVQLSAMGTLHQAFGAEKMVCYYQSWTDAAGVAHA